MSHGNKCPRCHKEGEKIEVRNRQHWYYCRNEKCTTIRFSKTDLTSDAKNKDPGDGDDKDTGGLAVEGEG